MMWLAGVDEVFVMSSEVALVMCWGRVSMRCLVHC